MSVEADLVTLLYNAGVTAYPSKAPNNAPLPYAVYRRIVTTPTRTHDGETHMQRARFQLDCYGQRKADVVAMTGTIRSALDINVTDFKLATADNELDVVEQEPTLYRTVLEFHIWY